MTIPLCKIGPDTVVKADIDQQETITPSFLHTSY